MATNRIRVIALTTILCACGEDDQLVSTNPYNPFGDGATTVIGGDPEVPVASGQVTEEGCLQVSAETCVDVEREGKYCSTDQGPVDVVVVDGVVVEVVCYEDTDGASGPSIIVDGDSDGDIDVPQNDNGAVITFDPSTDGKPIAGNVTLDGNNVTLYGNGPDKSIIDGNLTIIGNNARVRGVRVTGNVHINLNTAAVIFCVVEGNVHITSNNSMLAETDVFGNVQVDGNNCILVNNEVAGEWKIAGSGSVCDGNMKFTDDNGDELAQPEERGEALSCAASP
jgi:hypothetical protein